MYSFPFGPKLLWTWYKLTLTGKKGVPVHLLICSTRWHGIINQTVWDFNTVSMFSCMFLACLRTSYCCLFHVLLAVAVYHFNFYCVMKTLLITGNVAQWKQDLCVRVCVRCKHATCLLPITSELVYLSFIIVYVRDFVKRAQAMFCVLLFLAE